ncbi:pilus biogenesis protein PilL [Enterobacter cloacae]|uniref:Pilus biogenesis protein PilL n=1 Tax=Enterobacter cloacae TaxID=550 RepID=A0A377M9F4_ENTCL|nr:pilus biogenesis protein PilL [Enterobacter cloacae]
MRLWCFTATSNPSWYRSLISYRKAEKPLFAEANRIQCLISVSDTPTGEGT